MNKSLGYQACLKYLTYSKIPLIYATALFALGYGLWQKPWQEPTIEQVRVPVHHWLDMEIEVPEEQLFTTDLPDFSVHTDVAERKAAFFSFVYEFIEHENTRILALRGQLEPILRVVNDDDTASLSDRLRDRLVRIAEQYRLDIESMTEEEMARELELRVDIIPPSLVLAQAANESAWGTSRFAREANNLFGQWCFTEGCGLVPQRRIPGAVHEVRSFDSVADAVHAYYRNINTNATYEYLRELRHRMREEGQEPLDSLALAYGLTRYSERGSEYITELQSMIRFNRLISLDEQHLQLIQS